LIDDVELSRIIDRIRVNQRKQYLTQKIQAGQASDDELREFTQLVAAQVV